MELTNSLPNAGLTQRVKDAFQEGYRRATTKEIAYALVPRMKPNIVMDNTARQEIANAQDLVSTYSPLERIAFAMGVYSKIALRFE